MGRLSLTWAATAVAALPLILLDPRPAHAQASFSLAGETDYRVRGLSLSGGRPVVRAGAAFDHRSGLYAGATLVVGDRHDGDERPYGGVGYAGFARRTASGLTTDIGVSSTRMINEFSVRIPETYGPYGYTPPATYRARYRIEYSEVYAGLLRDNVSLHLYLSPNYLRPGQATAYVDFNAAVHPVPKLRLFGHAGVLIPLEQQRPEPLRSRADLRVGVALELSRAEVQLAWTAVSRGVDYPRGYAQSRDAVVLSAAAFF